MNDKPTTLSAMRGDTLAALALLRAVRAVQKANALLRKAAAEAGNGADVARLDAASDALYRDERCEEDRLAAAASAELAALRKDPANLPAPGLVARFKRAKRDGSWSGVYQYRDGSGDVIRESKREYGFTAQTLAMNLETGEVVRWVGGYGFSSSEQQMQRELRKWEAARTASRLYCDDGKPPYFAAVPRVLRITTD